MSSPANIPEREFDFESLVTAIHTANEHFTSQVSRAINVSITLRSWVIGFYIVEYEQGGKDRAEYGTRLIDELSRKLSGMGLARVEARDLRRYRSFAIAYPQIRESLTAKSSNLLPHNDLAVPPPIRQSATAISGEKLISSLSFTNTYVSWYDKNVREPGDNPPIGILLCTEKDHALVQYALAAMDNALFVSKYQLQLPAPEVLKQQLEAERRRLEAELESSNEQDEKDLHE